MISLLPPECENPLELPSVLFLLVKIGEGGVFATKLYKVTFNPFPQFFLNHYDSIENTSEINTSDTHKIREIESLCIYFFSLTFIH